MTEKDPLIGRIILDVRPMTEEEMEREGWEEHDRLNCTVIVLDDETILYASRDSEGNGAGALFGTSGDGVAFSYG